jgi:aryl-alcohol dehydrogenase-like predicted oxidoreductase
VTAVGELLADGSVRAWGIVNWPGERVAAAGRIAHDQGVPAPCAAQLPYNLIARDWVEGPEMTAALEECDARVVASFVLAGGALSGKYGTPGATGRLSGELDSPRARAALAVVEPLRALALELDTTPAVLAMAFTLANDDVASVLFGATTPEEVCENVRAAEVAGALSEEQLGALRTIGA